MEAPERRGRITPLPPPHHDGMGREQPGGTRPWFPVAAALAIFFVFGLWLAGSNNDDPSTAAAAGGSSATLPPLVANTAPVTSVRPPPTTEAPRLNELVPWLDGTVVLFGDAVGRESITAWRADDRTAQTFALSGSNVVDVGLEPATLVYLAYETAGTVQSLYLGGWQLQEPIFVGSRGFAWDPAGTATLAWVGTDQVTQTTGLYMKQLGSQLTRVTDLPDNSWLVGWTNAGLVTAERSSSFALGVTDAGRASYKIKRPTLTVLRDPAGAVLATAVAEPLRVAPSGAIVAVGTSDVFAAAAAAAAEEDKGLFTPPPDALAPPAELVILDVPTPDADPAQFIVRTVPVRDHLSDGEEMFSFDNTWSLSADGDWVGRLVRRANVTTLVVQSLNSQSVRVIPLRGEHERTTVGFSSNHDQFFAFSQDRAEVTVINWLTGAQFVFPIESTVRFGRAYIRPPAP